MSKEQWTAIDRYFESQLHPDDEALVAADRATREAGMPTIAVASNQGRFLQILALSIGAKRILELGTLGGYSTIFLARGLAPGGKVVTIELEPKHAEVAWKSIAGAGLADRVEIRVGAALDVLPKLRKEKAGPFDLVFIDADKENIPEYYEEAMKLSRVGTLIIVDNVVRYGAVIDANSTNADVQGVRRFMARMGSDPRVMSTALQTVGVKGHDGLSIARVVATD